MKKTKILLVSDGGVTKSLMQKMYELEPYGAEITLVEDTDMPSWGILPTGWDSWRERV